MSKVSVAITSSIQAFAASLQFLTRLPVPIRTTGSEAEFRRSTVFFPIAGLLIGAIVAAAGYGLDLVVPATVNAVLLVALWTFLSGALHLDGLMDSADALLSHRSPERMLEIMKDSRVGAMGVIVCVLYLLLKIFLLHSLLTSGYVGVIFLVVAIPVWSRAFIVTAIAGWPYARTGSGLGQLFRTVSGKHAIGAALLALLLSVATVGHVIYRVLERKGVDSPDWFARMVDFSHQGLPETLLMSLIIVAAMALISYGLGLFLARAISRKLGGLTGDIYGALNEIIEVCLMLVIVVVMI